MLLGLVGVPSLNLLSLRLVADRAGIEFSYLDPKKLGVHVVKVRPRFKTVFSQVTPLLLQGADQALRSFKSLQLSAPKYVGLVSASTTELTELGLLPVERELTALDLIEVTSSVGWRPLGRLSKLHDTPAITMRGINRESVLQGVQSRIYRIRDPVERACAQTRVYSFLSGAGTRPDCGHSFLDDALEGPLVKKFRKAVREARKSGIDVSADKYGIDRFEIAFVLSKQTK